MHTFLAHSYMHKTDIKKNPFDNSFKYACTCTQAHKSLQQPQGPQRQALSYHYHHRVIVKCSCGKMKALVLGIWGWGRPWWRRRWEGRKKINVGKGVVEQNINDNDNIEKI